MANQQALTSLSRSPAIGEISDLTPLASILTANPPRPAAVYAHGYQSRVSTPERGKIAPFGTVRGANGVAVLSRPYLWILYFAQPPNLCRSLRVLLLLARCLPQMHPGCVSVSMTLTTGMLTCLL